MKDINYYKKVSNDFITRIIRYYLSLQKNEMKTVSEIANDLYCADWSVRRFINSLDSEKGVDKEFLPEYKLVLTHTIFKKDNTVGSHYSNQQEYFKQLEEKRIKCEKREKAKAIALTLYKRQKGENKNGK